MKPSKFTKPIADYFANQPEVESVMLFGSQSQGATTPRSDIDVAVLFADSSQNTFYLQGKYIEELTHITGVKVDVVNLNSADIAFVYRVLSFGKLIYEKTSGIKATYQEKTVKRYFDLKPTYDAYYHELDERIHSGRFGKI